LTTIPRNTIALVKCWASMQEIVLHLRYKIRKRKTHYRNDSALYCVYWCRRDESNTRPSHYTKEGNPNPCVYADSNAKEGRITDPRASHAQVMLDAGIKTLTIHGLRRSYSLLGEAAGTPAGAIAQVMGHKPSATAEGYRPRSIDALRPYLAQIEAHILKQAGIKFDATAAPGALHLVA
jgi:integrase